MRINTPSSSIVRVDIFGGGGGLTSPSVSFLSHSSIFGVYGRQRATGRAAIDAQLFPFCLTAQGLSRRVGCGRRGADQGLRVFCPYVC